MLYSSNGGGMSGQKNDAAGSVGFFRQSLCDLFFFALVVDIEMGEDASTFDREESMSNGPLYYFIVACYFSSILPQYPQY